MKVYMGGAIVVAAIIAVLMGRSDAKNTGERNQLAAQNEILKARLAESSTQVTHSVDTVRSVLTKYKTLTDTARITDTVWVKEQMAAAAEVVQACSDLANTCQRFRVVANERIAGLESENRAIGQALIKQTRRARLLPYVAAGSFLLGVWVAK